MTKSKQIKIKEVVKDLSKKIINLETLLQREKKIEKNLKLKEWYSGYLECLKSLKVNYEYKLH